MIFGGGSYNVTSPLSSIYIHELFGVPQGNPLVNENEAIRTWTFTLNGPDLDQYD